MENKLSKELVAILACPGCKKALKLLKDKKELECVGCKQKYAIREGVPILMPVKLTKTKNKACF
jgi:uncharacterized protein YbaR (Trm112 family)